MVLCIYLKVFFLPGDNDIGGDEEIVIREKIDRFHLYFGSPEVIENKKIEYVMVKILKTCICIIRKI